MTAEKTGERTPPDRTAYQQQYYLTRREELAEAKRRRYQEDAAYHKAICEASTASKERHRRAREAWGRAQQEDEDARGIVCEGHLGPVRGYSLTTMAMALGIPRDTVKEWPRRGMFPPTPYRSRGGRALYSQAQIVGVVEALAVYHERYSTDHADQRRRVLHPDRLRALIERRWRAVGALVEEA